jgi:hypothetical protein
MSARGAAGAAAFLIAAGTFPAGAMLAPRDGHPVAIVHRSGDSPAVAEAVAAAGGQLLAMPGRHVTLARSGDGRFAGRLQASGAWLVVDAAALRACMGGASDAGASMVSPPRHL